MNTFPIMFGVPTQHDEYHDMNPTAPCWSECEWYAAERKREENACDLTSQTR